MHTARAQLRWHPARRAQAAQPCQAWSPRQRGRGTAGEDFEGGLFAWLDGDGHPIPSAPCADADLIQEGAPHTCAEYAENGYCARAEMIAEACPVSCGLCG